MKKNNAFKNNFKNILHSRNLKYGSNSAILIVAVIAIAVLVNVLVGIPDLKLDLTPNKLYSLSDITKNELKNLDKKVEIIGLFDDGKISSGTDYKEVTDLLSLYNKYENVEVKYVDPDKNPTIIKDLDPDGTMDLSSGDFVVRCNINGNYKKKQLDYYDLFSIQTNQYTFQSQKTSSTAEQGFTGAIRYVTSEKTPVVYFMTGQNEISVDSDYKTVKEYVINNNYDVKELNLLSSEKVPDDAEIVVVASPKSDITADERDKLEEYLDNGGQAIFMFDSLTNDPSLDEFNSLLANYNVRVNYDKIKENDASMHIPDDEYTILTTVKSNSIIPQPFNAILSNSRSISTLKNDKQYITITSLMSTSDQAVGEMINPSRGDNIEGPLDIAVAVEDKGGAASSKIIVMGNASFLTDSTKNEYGTYYRNSLAFFLYSLGWMTDNTDDVIVPAKDYDANQLQITSMQASITGIILVVVLPLIVLAAGLIVYLRRRHL